MGRRLIAEKKRSTYVPYSPPRSHCRFRRVPGGVVILDWGVVIATPHRAPGCRQRREHRGIARSNGAKRPAGAPRALGPAARHRRASWRRTRRRRFAESLVEEIKRQLQSEMGLLPIRVLRERRKSFVEVNAFDKSGSLRYSTAGYLGNGYFITVKHGVMALTDAEPERRIASIKVLYNGKQLSATVVDSGNADAEVHPGDWAIIKVRGEIDLPALKIDTRYPLRVCRADLPAGQRLLEGHHPQHRLRRSADG